MREIMEWRTTYAKSYTQDALSGDWVALRIYINNPNFGKTFYETDIEC